MTLESYPSLLANARAQQKKAPPSLQRPFLYGDWHTMGLVLTQPISPHQETDPEGRWFAAIQLSTKDVRLGIVRKFYHFMHFIFAKAICIYVLLMRLSFNFTKKKNSGKQMFLCGCFHVSSNCLTVNT